MENPGGEDLKTVIRADGNIPQTTTTSIFTSTGLVEIVQIYGIVGTAIQAQANNMKLGYDPGGGSQDICANLDINADGQNTAYTITGTAADAMLSSTAGIINRQADSLIPLFDGDIDVTTSASNTGTIEWTCIYRALEAGASVVAE